MDDVIVASADETLAFANGGLTFHASSSNVADLIRISACNVTGAPIDPPAAEFRYMVFHR
jgi:hypothetical protein